MSQEPDRYVDPLFFEFQVLQMCLIPYSPFQKWHFEIRDHDVMNYDDVLGTVDVDVDQFVRQDGTYRARLSTEGYLVIRKTTPIAFKLRAT